MAFLFCRQRRRGLRRLNRRWFGLLFNNRCRHGRGVPLVVEGRPILAYLDKGIPSGMRHKRPLYRSTLHSASRRKRRETAVFTLVHILLSHADDEIEFASLVKD